MKTLTSGVWAVTAIDAFDFDTIFNTDNCIIIYDANSTYKSWKPGRPINAVSAAEVGKGYIVVVTTSVDVTANFSAGLESGGGFANGLYINSNLVQDLTLTFYNHTDVETGLGDPITLNGGGNPIFIAAADFPVGADRLKVEGTGTINLVWYVVSDGNLVFFENDTDPGIDLTSPYVFNLSELQNVSVVDIQQHIAAAVNHFYFANLTADSIDIVKSSNHADVVHTVASGGVWVATREMFEGEDNLSIIPGGTEYKALLIQTNFSHTTSTIKYQLDAAGIQQIPAFYLNYDNLFLAIVPDASDAGSWT